MIEGIDQNGVSISLSKHFKVFFLFTFALPTNSKSVILILGTCSFKKKIKEKSDQVGRKEKLHTFDWDCVVFSIKGGPLII